MKSFAVLLGLLLIGFELLAYNTNEIQKMMLEAFAGKPITQELFRLSIDGHPLDVQIKNEVINARKQISNTSISVGLASSETHDECLNLDILPNNTGNLVWLSTKDLMGRERNCGIHPSIKKKGEFLLSFVDKVAKLLNLSKVSLEDEAKIWCPKNRQHIFLKLLKMVKSSPGWYEQHGYVAADLKRFKRASSALLGYDMANILQSIDNISVEVVAQMKEEVERMKNDSVLRYEADVLATYWDNFLRRKELLKSLAQNLKSPETVRSFLSSLYKDDGSTCDLYSDVTELIFPSSLVIKPQEQFFETNFPWLTIYDGFLSTGRELVRSYDSESQGKK